MGGSLNNTDARRARDRRRRDTLAARLATALVLIVVAATGAAAGWEYARGRAGLARDVQAAQEARARLAADRVERAVRERERLAALWPGLDVSQDLAVDDLDKRLSASLEELASHFGGGALALAADTAGRVVSASDRGWIGRGVRGEPWYLAPSTLAANQATARTADGRAPTLALAGPVRGADGRLLGSIVLLTRWRALVQDAVGEDAPSVVVRDAAGRTLFRGRDFPPVSRISGTAHTRVGVSVEAAVSTAAALGPLREAARRLVLLAALVLLVGVPGAVLLARSTTRELARLTRQAEAAQRTGTPAFAPADPAAPADVRTLAAALAEMAERVEASRRELARQETLAALGTMAAGLAHEVRTPLSVIRGSAEIIARAARPDTREAELGDFIIEEADRLGRLVDDMLAFARPREPRRAPIDLAEVAARVAEGWARGAHPSIALRTRLDPAPALGDAEQMVQVALNLATNAAQASPPGGEIHLRTGAEGGDALLEVEDSGRGISPDELERVWTPFFSRRPGGTGLGLPIVRRIVEAHGGRVEIESEVGRGTRVTVRLPLDRGPP